MRCTFLHLCRLRQPRQLQFSADKELGPGTCRHFLDTAVHATWGAVFFLVKGCGRREDKGARQRYSFRAHQLVIRELTNTEVTSMDRFHCVMEAAGQYRFQL